MGQGRHQWNLTVARFSQVLEVTCSRSLHYIPEFEELKHLEDAEHH